MHFRILAGVGAWLLGAATATAGSLLAVSLLGQGIADSPGQQLTAAAINSALASQASEAGQTGTGQAGQQGAPAGRPGQATAGPQVPASPATRPATTRPAATRPAPAGTRPAAARPTTPGTQAGSGTVLTSPGGTVLAQCRPGGAFLVSWSPAQGYQADSVTRGPAATAQVIFESSARSVTMVVSCQAGVPEASYTRDE